MPYQWKLHLVGESTLCSLDGTASTLSAQSKRFALLVYLAIPTPGRWVRRDLLLATFWPELDDSRARNALRVTLHQLRNTLGPDAIRSLGDEQLSLNTDVFEVDIANLLRDISLGQLQPWLDLSDLDLVPGLHVADSAPFHEWLDNERQSLRARVVAAAWHVAERAEARGDFAHALAAARLATRLARQDETGLRRLIGILDRSGDRAGAFAEFESFERWLREELEVTPSPETFALLTNVRDRTRGRDTPYDFGVVEKKLVAPLRKRRWVGVAIAIVALGLIAWLAKPTSEVAAPASVHVPDPEAKRLARNAAWLLSRRSREELLKARELYTAALEVDPEWSELWRGLAAVNGSLAYRHFIDYRSGFIESEHDANEALKRSPNNASALMERAMARYNLGNMREAEKDARRAAALDSTDYHLQSLIGTWWQWSGPHLDSALFYTERARRLAPWDRQIAINILQIVSCMDSSATLLQARRVLDIDVNQTETLEIYAWTLARFRRWDEASQAYERIYPRLVARGITAGARQLSGERRFRATVRSLRQTVYDEQRRRPPEHMPLLQARIGLFEDLGMRDSSVLALAGAAGNEEAHRANMLCAPNLLGFRQDSRVQAIVKNHHWPSAEFALPR